MLSGPSCISRSRGSDSESRNPSGSEAPWAPRTVASTPSRSAAQAPERNLKHTGRGRIKPLHIIDRDEHRTAPRQHLQHVANSQPNRMGIQRPVAGLGQQQRDLERPASRRRQRRRSLIQHLTK